LRVARCRFPTASSRNDGLWPAHQDVLDENGALEINLRSGVYLHYAYDLWVQRWRHTKANGDVIVVRFADDRAPRRREEEVTM